MLLRCFWAICWTFNKRQKTRKLLGCYLGSLTPPGEAHCTRAISPRGRLDAYKAKAGVQEGPGDLSKEQFHKEGKAQKNRQCRFGAGRLFLSHSKNTVFKSSI